MCKIIAKRRKETPVPYGQKSDAVSSRLFVSAFSAQKITNAIIRTIVASLFLAGGHILLRYSSPAGTGIITGYIIA